MEILAPAGSFQVAIAAFNSGADAVYLGLKSFSARKGAQNFTFEELRRLRVFASDKKIYITINTIIENNEIPQLLSTLKEISLIKIDAVIIQDIGLLHIIKKHFPDIVVHASTQMAVHNDHGVLFLKKQGVKRVVLSREVTSSKISELVDNHPDMEFEVFIHGALCFSFSGLCLASGLLLDRSGNKGACAQICRTYFEKGNKPSYLFSCNDLALEKEVLLLKKANVHSLKIEGRMKSADYVESVVELYKEVLKEGDKIGEKSRKTKLSFSRQQTKGFFFSEKGENLIHDTYTGHLGIQIGTIEQKRSSTRVSITPSEPLSVWDSIAIHPSSKEIVSPCGGMIKKIIDKKNRSIKRSKKGEAISIELSCSIPKGKSHVFLTSEGQKKKRDKIDIKNYPLYYHSLDATIDLNSTQLNIKATTPWFNIDKSYNIHIQEAEKPSNFDDALLKQFAKAGSSRFKVVSLTLNKLSEIQNPFIKPSLLKEIKNDFYNECNNKFTLEATSKVSNSIDTSKTRKIDRNLLKFIEKRENLTPKSGQPTPFLRTSSDIITEELASFGDYKFIPLPPVLINEAPFFKNLGEYIEKNPQEKILIGLNNVAHIDYCLGLLGHQNVKFFIDFYLYIANTEAINFFKLFGDKLLFTYYWIEGNNFSSVSEKSEIPLVEIKDKMVLPLFISQCCLHRESNQGCPKNCSKSYQMKLRNREKRFKAYVIDCQTYLYLER